MTETRRTGSVAGGWTRACAVGGLALTLLLTGCSGEPEREAQDRLPSPSVSASPPVPASPPPSPPPAPAATPTRAASPATGPSAQASQPTVPPRPVERLPPVPLRQQEGSETAAEAGALRIEVVDVAPVVSAGAGPGQIQGEPAVAFTVRWSNVGTTDVSLGTVVVDASYGQGVPASPVDGPPSRPVAASVPPGGSVTGVYVFAVPAEERSRVQVTVSEGPALPTAVFVGPVP